MPKKEPPDRSSVSKTKAYEDWLEKNPSEVTDEAVVVVWAITAVLIFHVMAKHSNSTLVIGETSNILTTRGKAPRLPVVGDPLAGNNSLMEDVVVLVAAIYFKADALVWLQF